MSNWRTSGFWWLIEDGKAAPLEARLRQKEAGEQREAEPDSPRPEDHAAPEGRPPAPHETGADRLRMDLAHLHAAADSESSSLADLQSEQGPAETSRHAQEAVTSAERLMPPALEAAVQAVLISSAPAAAEADGNKKRKRITGSSGAAERAAGQEQPCGQPSPLVAAAAMGRGDVLDSLIASGANVNAESRFQSRGGVIRITPLIAAISAGNARAVARLLAAGADQHAKCRQQLAGQTEWVSALTAAVASGRVEVVRQLVDAGACGDKGKQLPLRHPAIRAVVQAAALGRVDLLELLVPRVVAAVEGGHKALLANFSRSEARTPLAAAAAAGHLAAVNWLLEASAAAPADDASSVRGGHLSYTALHLAAEAGHALVVRRLVAAGASLLTTTGQQDIAASLALRHGHLEAVGVLLEGRGDEFERAEQLAAMARRLQTGFQAGSPWRTNVPSLQAITAERQALQALVLALAAGEPINPSAASVAAAAAGSARLLAHVTSLAGVACLSRADGEGAFPLLHACSLGWNAMQRLLQAGASPNQALPTDGQTVLLLLAAQPSLFEAAQRLVAWPGVDLCQRDAQGRDALGVAIQHRNRRLGEAVLQVLMGAGGDGAAQAAGAATRVYNLLQSWPGGFQSLASVNETEASGEHILAQQIKTMSRRQLQDLLAIPGIDVNARDAVGTPVLITAVRRRQQLLVRDLLATGRLDLDARDASGSTALLEAARNPSDVPMLRLLLAAGASPCVADVAGITPLMALAAAGQHRAMSELIASHGAALGVNQQSRDGRSALHFAAEGPGKFQAVKVLVNAYADVSLRTSQGKTAAEVAAESGADAPALVILDRMAAAAAEQRRRG